ADGAQSSRVLVPLLDDPYVAARQAQLVDTDTESDPEEAPSEAEESRPLASSDSSTPLSLDHPLTQASPTRALFHHRITHMTVRGRVRNEDTEEAREDESLDTDDERERSEDEGPGLEGEGGGLGYEAARRRALESNKDIAPSTYEVGQSSMFVPEHEGAERTPPSPEWSFGSLPVSPSSPLVPSHTASPVATPTATISINEDQFLEVRAVRDDFSQRYRFRSLEREQERATIVEERRERLELADHVARIKRRQEKCNAQGLFLYWGTKILYTCVRDLINDNVDGDNIYAHHIDDDNVDGDNMNVDGINDDNVDDDTVNVDRVSDTNVDVEGGVHGGHVSVDNDDIDDIN
ncbi:hypothetical protein Tco_0916198, partial [Tanacetum coccineum]